MKLINTCIIRNLGKSCPGNEVIMFYIVMILKLMIFNVMVEINSITNIALLSSITGTVLILTSWTSLLPGKMKLTTLYMINCALTFIMAADMLFYRYFSDVLSMPVITQASVVSSVKSSIFSLVHFYDIIFVLDLVIIPIVLFRGKIARCNASLRYKEKVIKAIFAFVIGLGLSSYGVASLLKTQPYILNTFYDRVFIVQNIGLLSFHGIDAFRFMQSKDKEVVSLSAERIEELKEFLREKKEKEQPDSELFGAGKGKNLIVIQVEALQGFVINRSINGREITPNLNKLVKNSLYFDNYYTQTAGGGTSDAELLSNVSMFPAKEGSAYIRFSGNDYYSLAKRLKEEGYYSSAMHAFKAGFWNRSVMYRTLGFDSFFSKNNFKQDEISGMGLSDKSFFRQSLEYMETYKEPYYTLLITLTSHYPFDNDKKYYSSFDVGEYKDTFFGDYLEAIHYADEALGEFIEALELKGLMDRSVLAVYGDHFAIPKDKREYLVEYLGLSDMEDYNWVKHQKVPLIIHVPGGDYKGIRHIAGGGVDFMPTILNIMGVDGSGMPMLGRDLLNSSEGMAVLRHGNFITDEYIYLASEGTAFDAETGMSYPIEKLAEEKRLAERHLEFSDMILENNLVIELMEFLKK